MRWSSSTHTKKYLVMLSSIRVARTEEVIYVPSGRSKQLPVIGCSLLNNHRQDAEVDGAFFNQRTQKVPPFILTNARRDGASLRAFNLKGK